MQIARECARCISRKFQLGNSKPAFIEGVVESGDANDEHALTSRCCPAHAGTGKAGLELFDAAFESTGADREAIFTRLLILHAALMVVEITTVLGQVSLVQGRGDGMGTLPKNRSARRWCNQAVARGSWSGNRAGGGVSQVLTGMEPIHNLGTVREIVVGQVPNPFRPIGGHAGVLGR